MVPPIAEAAHSGTFEHHAPKPGPEHARLEVFIGKWINGGETVATPDAPAAKIVTNDVYEWIPGRFAMLHTAYGDLDVGGVEILGYDAESGKYTSHFFDSQGHVTVDDLIYIDGRWIWSGERIRTTSEFSEDGKATLQSLAAAAASSGEGKTWLRVISPSRTSITDPTSIE